MVSHTAGIEGILSVLYERAGFDFREYREGTVQRRLSRRLQVCRCEDIDDYVQFLHNNPSEYACLAREMTIHVTEFFRDPECYHVLEEKVFPELIVKSFLELDGHDPSTLNVWSAGCSTGEEVYSLAIIFDRWMKKQAKRVGFTILGTDLDQGSIDIAVKARFSKDKMKAIAQDIIKNYFHRIQYSEMGKDEWYQIHESFNSSVSFERSDLIHERPAGKFDLIVCRNVLIYFSKELQEKVIRQFSTLLKPGGYLWLGNSESLWGETQDLWECVDKGAKIFRMLVCNYRGL